MESNGKLDDNLLKGLFENGFMGIEIDEKYGGAGCNFMTSILAVEEVSKVDMGVAVLVHIQNTLVNTLISRLGTEAQKEKYLTKLATTSVSSSRFQTD
jgi:short-chain 2-methylacyl-CoA dehydrogenase